MPASAAVDRRTSHTFLLLTAVVLALLAALPYLAGGVSRSFIALDDQSYVLDNPQVRAGLTAAGVLWALTSFEAANWHPLTWLSQMADVSLFGLDARGHHLTSIVLHAAATALLFLVLFRLTGSKWPSALSAAVFGVHPLRVESVAWVAERKDVLSGLFFMLVLLAYERFARRGGAGRYVVVLVLLALGLMAKPMLVTVPAVLLLLDYWPLGRTRWNRPPGSTSANAGRASRLIVEKLPLLALAAASSVLTVLAQRSAAAIADLQDAPLAVREANAVVSVVVYIGKVIWPAALAIYYPHPRDGLPAWKIAGAACLVIGATVAALGWLRRRPSVAVGWLWFLGMLLPVIGLVQVGQQALADRYTYLPMIGLLIGAAWTVPRPLASGRRGAIAVGAVAIVVALSAVATAQVRRWRDTETLFRHTLAVTTDNWAISNNLADHLWERGRRDEARALYRDAVRVSPALGLALYRIGQPEAAEAEFRQQLRRNPNNPETLVNLGNLLDESGRGAEAIELYRAALRLRPDGHVAHNNLGASLESLGRNEEAMEHYRRALRSRPDYPEALYNLGRLLARTGQREEAVANLREFLRQRPDYAPAQRQLAELTAPGRE